MSNPEMNTAGQERAQTILKARQDAKKSELQRRVELINKLGKYRPNMRVELRMLYDEVWLDVLDLAIKSKEYNQKD